MATIETYDVITLDMLSKDSVSILKRTYVNINDTEVQVGPDWRRAYINSESDRIAIAEFLGESPQLSAVMEMWGDTPSVDSDSLSESEEE